MTPLLRALEEDDPSAQSLFDAACESAGIELLPDHDPETFEGVLQGEALGAARVENLARSWEQLDRAYAPSERDVAQLVTRRLAEFVAATGLALDLGDDHLFVFDEGAMIASLPGESWDVIAAEHCRQRGLSGPPRVALRALGPAMDAFRSRLRRGPRPRGRSPASGQ